jgi:hypothetical protein
MKTGDKEILRNFVKTYKLGKVLRTIFDICIEISAEKEKAAPNGTTGDQWRCAGHEVLNAANTHSVIKVS